MDTLHDLAAAYTRWLSLEVESGRARPRTWDYYQTQLRPILRVLGHTELGRLLTIDLAYQCRTWHSIQAIKRVFSWGIKMQLVQSSPAAALELPALGERERTLGQVEELQLLRAAGPSLRALCMLQRETLARPGEVRGLRWKHFLEAERCFVLNEFKGKGKRKDKAKTRVLLLSDRAMRLVMRLRQRAELVGLAGPNDPVVFNRRGAPWSTNALRIAVRSLCRRLDLDEEGEERIVSYTWRHTAATRATANGVQDRMLADIMGHSSTRTTARYQHLQLDHLRAGLKRATQRRLAG